MKATVNMILVVGEGGSGKSLLLRRLFEKAKGEEHEFFNNHLF